MKPGTPSSAGGPAKSSPMPGGPGGRRIVMGAAPAVRWRKRRTQPEFALHCVVADYLKLALDPAECFFTTIEHGGWRQKATAGRMKRVGVKPGIPDLMLIPKGGHVFFIELKAPNGRPSPEQIGLHLDLHRLGVTVFICKSLDEVQAALAEMGVLVRDRNARAA